MSRVTDEDLAKLEPYFAGQKPDARGEAGMYCPLHFDSRRSAQLNVNNGKWICFAGCGGGGITQLIDAEATWKPMEGRTAVSSPVVGRVLDDVQARQLPSLETIQGWNRKLLKSPDALRLLWRKRGITKQTVKKAMLGHDGRLFKIPVFAPDRSVWNVRTYDMRPGNGRRKIWSIRGHGAARLYPVGVLSRTQPGDAILICEGEWDALLALQAGYTAVTRTGAAKVWQDDWSMEFADLRVYLCHDADEAGINGNLKVAESLADWAREVRFCQLPYEVSTKGGADLTDYLLEADEPSMALGELMDTATTSEERTV